MNYTWEDVRRAYEAEQAAGQPKPDTAQEARSEALVGAAMYLPAGRWSDDHKAAVRAAIARAAKEL